MEKQKTRKLPKRILAWIVCFAMAVSVLTVIPGGTMEVQAASADGAKIVAAAQSYMGKEQSVGRCLGFCRLVYRDAGYDTAQDPNGCSSACAYHSWTVSSHLGSTSKDNIPLGALVFFSGASSQSVLSCGARPGHVGIYVGDGYIINARGTVTNGTNIKKDKISLWESWGYAFLGWRPISGYTLDSGGSAVNSFISYMERPASGGNYSGPIQILGYALHKNGIRNVTAWINGQVMDCPMYNSPDVAEVYPGYPTGNEGFQTQIPISCLKEGENEIDIYAYERDDTPHLIASHKFNWSSFVGKLESPVQNGSYDGTLSIQGYALHKNGIKNVTAWVNGQVMDCPMYNSPDVAKVYPGYPTGNEGFQAQIPISCLKEGENEIDIYAYEFNDWPHNIASYKFNYVKESQKPVISDVEITDFSAIGYTVKCTVTDDSGINRVQFPTWTVENDQDDLAESWWDNPSCSGTQDGTTWSFRVNDKDHNFERGIYRTHIYAYDINGNGTCYELNNIDFQNTYSHVNTVSYNGHTYYLYNDCLTWDEAKAKCEELGGHLVTITSADEQETVAGLIQRQARRGYWIGGSSDNGSTWVNGEEFSYSNWEPGEPNADGGEDCYGIYTDKGTWNNWLGSDRTLGLGFVCEWDEEKVDNSDNPDNPDKESSTTYTYKLNDDKTTITITKYTASDENVVIPSSIDGYVVTGIDEKAFQNITTMKTILFPSSLKSIGNYAFAGCTSLTMVTLPESLTELGNYAFQGCVALKSAKLNAGWKNVSEGLFQGCTSLSSVTLPDTIQYIRLNAFSGCTSLKTLSLPKSLSIIYANAFLNASIKTVQYTGTNTDWQNVTIGTTGNTSFLNATVVGSNGKTFSANKSKWNASSPAPVKKPTVSKVKSFKAKAAKKKLTLSWKKLSGAAGYQIQISTKKNFKGAKKISISKSKKTYTKKKLKAKKKYYIRVRAYKTYKDANKKTKKVYGKWTTINKKTK